MLDAYKTFTGSYSPLKDGDEKHSADYKILESDEYNDLIRQINTLKRQLSAEKQEHESDVKAEQDKAQRTCDSYKKQCSEKIAEWKQYAETCKAKQEQAESLNVNLKRICKENANAKRGRELLRLIEVGASCFNHYCLANTLQLAQVLHSVHKR